MHRGGSGDAFESAVERLQSELARLLRPRLHIGLVDLHDVGTCGEQIANLRVHGDRVVHRRFFLGFVVVGLRLLAHGEGTGHGHFHRLLRVGAQKLQVLDLYGVPPADLSDDARHRVGMPRAVECRSRVDDVQSRFLLGADREQRRVLQRLGEKRLGDAPQLFRAHARRKAPGELLPVDQPLRLRVAADERGRKQHAQGFSPWNSFSRPSLVPGLPSYRKMSAVAKVSLKFSGIKEPVPTTSSGALPLANILHLNSVNPDEPTILQALKPFASRVCRSWMTAATETPVPNSTLRTRSLTMFRLSASNASSPIT